MKKIVVTGGSGGGGRYVVNDLREHGYEVLNLDLVPLYEDRAPFRQVDLTDYARTFAAMYGYDAVVHFGANPIPDSDFLTGADRFHNNTLSTYNVFNAAAALGMERVIWASSDTVFGYPYKNVRPDFVPIDENHEIKPQNSYALSKVICEELARQMNRLFGLPIIALRFSNILHKGTWHPANYAAVPNYWHDPHRRKSNLWGYIDARDAATSVRLSLESGITNADEFIIAAVDTIMDRPSADLMAAVFPDVPIKEDLGQYEALMNINKARKTLGFKPQYSWRDHV